MFNLVSNELYKGLGGPILAFKIVLHVFLVITSGSTRNFKEEGGGERASIIFAQLSKFYSSVFLREYTDQILLWNLAGYCISSFVLIRLV